MYISYIDNYRDEAEYQLLMGTTFQEVIKICYGIVVDDMINDTHQRCHNFSSDSNSSQETYFEALPVEAILDENPPTAIVREDETVITLLDETTAKMHEEEARLERNLIEQEMTILSKEFNKDDF